MQLVTAVIWWSPMAFSGEQVETGYRKYATGAFAKVSLAQQTLGLGMVVVLSLAHLSGVTSRPIFSNINNSVGTTFASAALHVACVILMVGWPKLYQTPLVWETLTVASRCLIMASGRELFTYSECNGREGFASITAAKALTNGSFSFLTFMVTLGQPLPLALNCIMQLGILVLTISGNGQFCSAFAAEPQLWVGITQTAEWVLSRVHVLLWYPVAPASLFPDYLQGASSVSCEALFGVSQLVVHGAAVMAAFWWEVAQRRAYLRSTYPREPDMVKWPYGYSSVATLCLVEWPAMLLLACFIGCHGVLIYGSSAGWGAS
jgi:hypothetical protein